MLGFLSRLSEVERLWAPISNSLEIGAGSKSERIDFGEVPRHNRLLETGSVRSGIVSGKRMHLESLP